MKGAHIILPEPPKWAAGLSCDPVKQTPGIWIERDVWRVRVRAVLNQQRQDAFSKPGIEARIRVEIAF